MCVSQCRSSELHFSLIGSSQSLLSVMASVVSCRSIVNEWFLSIQCFSPDVGGQQLSHELLFEVEQSIRSLVVAL